MHFQPIMRFSTFLELPEFPPSQCCSSSNPACGEDINYMVDANRGGYQMRYIQLSAIK